MLELDRPALECDFAQYYGIYDITMMPPGTIINLACGLPAESRIVKKLSKSTFDLKTMLMASIADHIALLVWFQTKDGRKNRNRPKSFTQILAGKNENTKEVSFASPEEFEQKRQQIIKGA